MESDEKLEKAKYVSTNNADNITSMKCEIKMVIYTSHYNTTVQISCQLAYHRLENRRVNRQERGRKWYLQPGPRTQHSTPKTSQCAQTTPSPQEG